VFIVPIVQVGATGTPRPTIGMLLLEDPRRDPAARDIARACASLVALRAPAVAPPADRPGAEGNAALPGSGPLAAPTADERGLDAALAAYGSNSADLVGVGVGVGGGCAGARAAVLVLRLPDADIARVTSDAAGVAASLAHRIACSAQEIASARAIPYLKMMGATIVAATGLDPSGDAETAGATRRLADMAIALRECCAAAFESADGSAEFRMGLDVGLVLGGTLGSSPGLLNLWGEALQGAETLANSAPDGTIQAGEQAYRLLRQDFLFRPRGLFHRPRVGESRSYLLAGRV
jgi:adenylate cyclase